MPMATATNLVPHKIFLAGRWVDSPDVLRVTNPARPDEPAGLTYQATPEQYEEAVQAAVAAFEVTRTMPAYERGAILRNISAGIRARREELGRLIAMEAGKPIRDALVEVDRAALTFRLGAETDLGPMVDAKAAARTQAWVDEAVAAGAHVLLGGRADGTLFPPTILAEAPLDAKVCSEEAFAPLVVLARFSDFGEAVAQANDSRFGLQAGVFTNDLANAFTAFDRLEVGGVILNDIPTYRIDNMPYGGVKDSGLGREGLRYAIEDMTEIRILVVAQPGSGGT